MTKSDPKKILLQLWQAALDAADPFNATQAALPVKPDGRVVVIGAGKASGRMAEALEAVWGAGSGLVVVPHGYGRNLAGIELLEAAHPVPDAASTRAATRILALAQALSADDTLVCLISGGGSALLSAPVTGVSEAEKRRINEALLASGARIQDMNCVRKHLSAIKGGRLAVAAAPAHIITLAVSDVVGDDLSVIASGPTSADPTTNEEALAILSRYEIDVPASVSRYLQAGHETPKPDNPVFGAMSAEIVVKPIDVLDAVEQCGRELGLKVLNLGDAIEGEAREVGKTLAGIAHSIRHHHRPAMPPALILSGGETTVTVAQDADPDGKGGRNTECALGFALTSLGEQVFALFADTDGIDGKGGHAGAFVTPRTLNQARENSLDAQALLNRNNSAALFAATGDLITTGPTATNVNDFRAVLVL